MKQIYLLIFFILFFSCTENSNNKNIEKVETLEEVLKAERDSLVKDSIKTIEIINKLDSKNNLQFNNFKILVLNKPKLTNNLRFHNEYTDYATYFEELKAKKDERILNIKLKLITSNKPDKPETFFPKINVFKYNKIDNKIIFYDNMKYGLLNASKLNIIYLEQIFEYQNSETFICYITIPKNDNNKYIISVSDNNDFRNDNVIGFINNY